MRLEPPVERPPILFLHRQVINQFTPLQDTGIRLAGKSQPALSLAFELLLLMTSISDYV